MPSTYAHYRFGKRVLERLDGEARRIAERHRALFDVGLHGPDVLFHYRAFARNPVNRLGHEVHAWTGRRFFAQALPAAADDEARAYLYGFLCHFALDSTCHGLIERTVEDTGVDHNSVETDYERTLMLADGLDPARYLPAAHFAPSPGMGQVIASFFPGVEGGQAVQAVRAMRRNLDLLVAQTPLKRRVIQTVLRAAGQYDALYGLVVPEQPDPRLAPCTQQLLRLGAQAEETAARLIGLSGSAALLDEEQMQLNFNGQRITEEVRA